MNRIIAIAVVLGLLAAGEALAIESKGPSPVEHKHVHKEGWNLGLTIGGSYMPVKHRDHLLHNVGLDVGILLTYRHRSLELFFESAVGGDIVTGAFEVTFLWAALLDIHPRLRIGPGAMMAVIVEKDGAHLVVSPVFALQATLIYQRLELFASGGPAWIPAAANADRGHGSGAPQGAAVVTGLELLFGK